MILTELRHPGLGRYVHALVDLVLPICCVGCGAQMGAHFCPACAAHAWPGPRRVVPSVTQGLPPTWASAPYAGGVRAALIAHKERGRAGLVGPLGRLLAPALLAAAASARLTGSGRLLVVPIPSSPASRRSRREDPLLRLVRPAVAEVRATGSPAVLSCVLRHVRRVGDQSGLSAGDRHRNLAGALAVLPGRLRPGDVAIVVDDILTTGATLTEAARALRAGGASDVRAAVVAETRKRKRDARGRLG